MRVTSVEATAPNGRKYEMTRLGRIIGTGSLGAYGYYKAQQLLRDDTYVKELLKNSADEAEKQMKSLSKSRKVAYGLTTVAITSLCGFLLGGVVDFFANKAAKKKAMNSED